MNIRKTAHPGTGQTPASGKELEQISIGFLISIASLGLKKHFSQAISAAGYQISTEQYSILSQLWRQDNITQRELGKRVFKDRHNVSRIIKSLEQKALIVKKPDASDARITRCVLTPKGRSLQTPLCRISAQVLETAFQGMDDAKIQQIKTDLIHLLLNLGENPI